MTDLFSVPRNMDEANMVAGRSVAAVDRNGTGKYGFFVANYGGIMKVRKPFFWVKIRTFRLWERKRKPLGSP